ncbi:MAG: hypothetical protein J7L45_00485, partial [Candidatus Aenigmarchaeota archaeon]|nr:hypothetical protein [Candidatus Aenigmarchaeota archaeon]
MKKKFSPYPHWVFDDSVTLWSYRNDSLNLTGDKGKKAVDLVGSMFEEFYRDTDNEVFTLISEDPSSRSYVKIVGNENARLTFYPEHSTLKIWFKVFTMKRENIPKVRSLLDDWKLLFLADVKFDEFLKEVDND